MSHLTSTTSIEALADRNTPDTPERLSGIKWLRDKIEKHGRFNFSIGPAPCTDHYHAECMECGSVKCVGKRNEYRRYDTITQQCDCSGGIHQMERTDHLVVPFDNFGRYFGFPE